MKRYIKADQSFDTSDPNIYQTLLDHVKLDNTIQQIIKIKEEKGAYSCQRLNEDQWGIRSYDTPYKVGLLTCNYDGTFYYEAWTNKSGTTYKYGMGPWSEAKRELQKWLNIRRLRVPSPVSRYAR